MKGKKVYFIGFGIILLAVLLVLGVIFLPRLAASSDMREMLECSACADAQYVMLVDPSFEHAGVLAGEGREVRLEGAELEFVRTALSSIAEDFSYLKKEGEFSGAMGMYLLTKDAEGQAHQIFFAKEHFYATLKGARYYFAADDATAYQAFYDTLVAMLDEAEK